jgi:hypothetical protein
MPSLLILITANALSLRVTKVGLYLYVGINVVFRFYC